MSNYDPNYVPTNPCFHLGVKVIVVNSTGKILLLKRSNKVTRAHGWDLSGGGVDEGEDPAAAAIREVKEETCLEIIDPRPIATHTYSEFEGKTKNIVIIGYWAKALSEEITLSWEHEEYNWLNPQEALGLDIPEAYKTFLKLYLDQTI